MPKTTEKKTLGFAITGSFCTFSHVLPVIEGLTAEYDVVPIFSDNAYQMDTRFWKAAQFQDKITSITGHRILHTIQEVEPFGPTACLDALVIAPCTGNTLAKLCHGITDTPVLMAAKAHLRNEKPLILSISTNDALGVNFKNIGELMNRKHIFFVPFGQDQWKEKPQSMISHIGLVSETVSHALEFGRQIQPVIR